VPANLFSSHNDTIIIAPAAAPIFAYTYAAELSRPLDFPVKQLKTAVLPPPSLEAEIYILYAALASSICLPLYENLKIQGLESKNLRTRTEEALEMTAAYSRPTSSRTLLRLPTLRCCRYASGEEPSHLRGLPLLSSSASLSGSSSKVISSANVSRRLLMGSLTASAVLLIASRSVAPRDYWHG